MDSDRPTSSIATVIVVSLVVLSGCSGFLGGDGDAGDGADPTGSPGTGDATGTPPEEMIAPGVNATALVDPAALLSAHREAMAEDGFAYTFEHRYVTELPNGTEITEIDAAGERRASAGLAAFHERVDRDVPVNETTSVWTNGTAGFERVVADDTTYDNAYGGVTERDTAHYLVERMLTDDDWRVEEVSQGGDRITLVSDNMIEGRLVVDDEGRIRSLDATIRLRQWDDEREMDTNTTRTLVFEVTKVGNVSASPPDWVDDARNATGRLRAPVGVHP